MAEQNGHPASVQPTLPTPPAVPLTVPSPEPSLAPRTTAQEDLTTAGQRKINLIWEYTQAAIALVVVMSTMGAGLYATFHPNSINTQVPTIMSVAFGTVVGFYFSRSNHAAIGGIGPKPNPPYEGR